MSIENNKIIDFYMGTFEGKKLNENLIEFLTKEYGYVSENEFLNLLINNFILIQSEVMRDLKEINDRINSFKKLKQNLTPNDYEYRKISYCEKINIEAKSEIEDFLVNDLIGYVKDRVLNKRNWERSIDDLGKLFDVPPYKYSHYRRYYNPDYDFSTDTKYRFLLHHNSKRIQKKIDLKNRDVEKYYSDLDDNMSRHDLLQEVISGVKSHHILCKRNEIFESLYTLFIQEKYQTFINLAVIQVEGLFYDFCLFLNDEIESDDFGTLSVKAERVFAKNPALWLSIYPYFAFDVPIYRNKIAHNGFWDTEDMKNFANELIYDLLSIINTIKISGKFPYNLLGLFLPLRNKVKTLEYSPKDYGAIIYELFGASEIFNAKEIFDLIKNREAKKEILKFYSIKVSEFTQTNLYDECCLLTKVIEDEEFWDKIIEILSSIERRKKGKPFDFINFVNSIVNSYIGEFAKGSELKSKCISLKKDLGRFKD